MATGSRDGTWGDGAGEVDEFQGVFPRGGEDVFPTVYRCNTIFKLRRALSRAGFDHCVYGYQSQPSSLAFSPFLYFWGVVHQHLAPSMVKPTLFAFARKNSSEEHP